MNFILQTINGKVTLDMCFQMVRAKEYWDWRNPDDSFKLRYCDLEHIECFDSQFRLENCFHGIFDEDFVPEEWCPVGKMSRI